MYTFEFFVNHISPSLNTFSGHPKSAAMYGGEKKKILKAMMLAGVERRMEVMTSPVTLAYHPQVTVNPRTKRILKGYDSINFAMTYKIIEDYLVKFGKLKDDRSAYVRASICHAPVVTDQLPGVRVVVTAINEDLPAQIRLL